MEFNYRYLGETTVSGDSQSTQMNFAPDTLRKPVHFVATLNRHLPFREAISALHAVVVSDMRFKPKDRQAYFAWLQQQEDTLLAEFIAQAGEVEEKIKPVREELAALRKNQYKLLEPYYKAQNQYFKYLYQHDMDAWFVLDPVITVHPDQVFYECFSQDESSYGCLRCSHSVFDQLSDFSCGTTNVDYSQNLYHEFQKIRDYKATQFRIDPEGFEVQTDQDERYKELKIDLPDSWLRGFLQVSSAMTLPIQRFTLQPMDIHNLCFVLRRRKERVGPRSIRFVLSPGRPVVAVFEPWNQQVVLRSSVYTGNDEAEVRVWGRRRLLILERLIPIAHSFTVHLLGSGLPSFFVAHMPDMSFTLGLSGWTANDWSRAGNFDLMAPRADVDDIAKQRVFHALEKVWMATAQELAATTGYTTAVVKGALSLYTQAGSVIYDLIGGVYRLRELSREALPLTELRYQNERDEKANRFIAAELVVVNRVQQQERQILLEGTVTDAGNKLAVSLIIDGDQRMVEADCACHFHRANKLYKGPCEHILALRMQHAHDNREIQLYVA